MSKQLSLLTSPSSSSGCCTKSWSSRAYPCGPVLNDNRFLLLRMQTPDRHEEAYLVPRQQGSGQESDLAEFPQIPLGLPSSTRLNNLLQPIGAPLQRRPSLDLTTQRNTPERNMLVVISSRDGMTNSHNSHHPPLAAVTGSNVTQA